MLDRAPSRGITPALEARDVTVRRCGRSLVQRVSLTVDRGELLVLLGDRGSGTDTVLALLAGRALPDAGKVLVDGRVRLERSGAGARGIVVADGPVEADALLDGHCAPPPVSSQVSSRGRIVLLDRALDGVDDHAGDGLLARCRAAADTGDAVVVTAASASLAARHATTVALFVAGRLLSWGAPGVALVPALQLLSCASAAR